MVLPKRRLAFTTLRGFMPQNTERYRTGRVKHLDVSVSCYLAPYADTALPSCFKVVLQPCWTCAWDRHSREF